MNGGAGMRFWVRTAILRTSGRGVAAAPRRGRSAVASSVDVERLAVDADELGGERLAGRGRQDRLDRPVLAGGERVDLALALDDQADRDRLDAAGGQAAA